MLQALAHSSIAWILHVAILIGFSVRVITRRPATGVALAWLFIMAAIPFVGVVAYFAGGRETDRA